MAREKTDGGGHSGRLMPHGNHALLERSRVSAMLDAAMKNALVVVTAGAGYGKTRAVHSYMRERRIEAAWIQLSESDNEKPSFWENFCGSLGRRMKRLGARLAVMGFPDRSQIGKYCGLIRAELPQGKKNVFVFDDCHLLTDKDVRGFIEQMLLSLESGATALVISRTEPPLDIMPLIMKYNVAFITEDDLRFTKRELEAFFYHLGISLPAASVADIYEDTKGWALSVNLVSLSLMKSGGNEKYARAAMRRNVFKLIDSEIFSSASEGLRRFLVRLSLIEHLPAALVRSLADSPKLCGELESVSSFVRYDHYLNAYRIHHLFLDFLRGEQGMLTDGEKTMTWRMAAEWCRQNDFTKDAISYYAKAGGYAEVIDIIRMDLPQQIPYGTAEFVLGVLDGAPEGASGGIPMYRIMRMRTLMSLGRTGEAEEMARDAIREFEKKPETAETCRMLSHVHTALGMAGWMDSPRSDDYSFDGHFVKGFDYYKKFPFEFSGPSSVQSAPAYACIVGTVREGAIEEYTDAVERSAFYAAKVMNGCMAGIDLLARGEMLFYRADVTGAEVIVRKALRVASDNGQHDIRNRALYYLMRIFMSQGRYESIQAIIGQLETQLENKDYRMRQITYDIVMGWYYGSIGQHSQTAGWLGGDFDDGEFGEYIADFANMKKAGLFYGRKLYEAVLDFVRGGSRLSRFLYGRIELKILEALCLYKTKAKEAAVGALEAAYGLSAANGLDMPFIEMGKDMRTLTSAARKIGVHGIPEEWLERIHRKSATYAKRLSSIAAAYRKENGLDEEVSLSPRESEVLSDICSGLSRAEVAAKLGLSVNTVKAVTNIIYMKMGVHNTADVIRMAIEKDLLIR
ncbi:MAG: LuxR C-terminal-related transcriptional regulator [Clostridiales Family XIII bacterium]|jgi:LuxR family maltose regulon positive regulatory protein|nr:LuxR C-terminal-related transcriptional regulator [Clostridiales Family XIII bacterium]